MSKEKIPVVNYDKMKEVKLTIRIPAALHEKLREKGYKERRSLNSLIIQAIEKYLEKK